MADSKISNLDALAAVDLDTTNDLVAVVDTSATQTKKISVGEVLGNLSTLNAIDTSITATAVDVFVYDTSKDSDGGAWRKRCQHTSWYNETINTATRGSRREFPAVAVIVATADAVTIYDGDDPSLPMWMVFQGSYNFATGKMLPVHLAPETNISSVVAKNASLLVGSKPGTLDSCGLVWIDFISDKATFHNQYSSDTGLFKGAIAQRNSGVGWSGNQPLPKLVNSSVNDVSMTILPDAPTDPATGLPVPTIAVATDGGVSVIKDDGTVVDITYTAKNSINSIAFDDDNNITFVNGLIGTSYQYAARKYAIPATDIAEGDGASSSTNDLRLYFPKVGITGGDTLYYQGNSAAVSRVVKDIAIGNSHSANGGLTHLNENVANPPNGMVAYTTSTYNTGWMNGDIKGAFLADTDDTDLVGSGELVTNGTFDTDTSGWSVGNSNAANTTLASTSSQLVVTSIVNDTNGHWAQQAFSTVVGKTYTVSAEYVGQSNTSVRFARVGGVSITASSGIIASASNPDVGVFNITFVATSTTTYVAVGHGHSAAPATSTWDNISVKLADADRSVNNNGLIVNGTVTRSAVATGADLVAYSGFSSSNYLEQPYNADLDFGTGELCVMGWLKQAANTAVETILERDSTTTAQRFTLAVDASGFLTFTCDDDTTARTSTSNRVVDTDVWTHFTAIYDGAGNVSLYLDGALDDTETGSALLTLDNTAAVLSVGLAVDGAEPLTNGDVALLRISATAPTATQIAKIYEDEKFLFQDNAACTLYGTSDAVTALAHDPDTNLLHVGTSAGRSVFQGLRRVDQTSTPVTTAISAVDGLVVEQ